MADFECEPSVALACGKMMPQLGHGPLRFGISYRTTASKTPVS
jgi:hypothetical protein